MSRIMRVAKFVAVLAVAACSSKNTENNGGDVADFHQQLSEALQNNLAGFGNGLHRLLLAATGTPQTGVTLTPITGGVQGSVGVDVDGNGSLETTVNGKLIYVNPSVGISAGANLTVTGISGGAPQTLTASAAVAEPSPSLVTVTNGTLDTHTQTRGNDLSLSAVNLTVDLGGGGFTINGAGDFVFNGLDGRLTFQPNGTGFKITVSGNGFTTFTIP